jgi:DNA-directed RNA polymerase subunit E"
MGGLNMAKEKSCKICKYLTTENVCPNCGNEEFTENFKGVVVVLNPENSEVAKKLNISNKGKFALKHG